MLPNQKLNCVIIGYNDIDFATTAASQKRTENISGAYQEIKANSVLLRGQRYTYMEIINQAIARAQGSNPRGSCKFFQLRQGEIGWIAWGAAGCCSDYHNVLY